ncbi:MAG: purine-binding chemotaxis protein CheW [Candidatus Delongbacteria bacterium]|nr:purine-binding chemotaxis protein CheW [Candidatus Delongbacteria bacterium]MBN2834058.1 purine-binding chemotaxis protein CheW [Candidatus Delongbacteria bacterium]
MSEQDLTLNEKIVNSTIMVDDKHLTLRLDGEDYALKVKSILEIVGIVPITSLPNLPVYVMGVINLRGKVFPVIDIRKRFGLEEIPYNDRTCIIIVHNKGMSVGLIVDDVSEVISIPEERILPPPKITKSKAGKFIKGLGKTNNGVKLILDIHKILFDEINEDK